MSVLSFRALFDVCFFLGEKQRVQYLKSVRSPRRSTASRHGVAAGPRTRDPATDHLSTVGTCINSSDRWTVNAADHVYRASPFYRNSLCLHGSELDTRRIEICPLARPIRYGTSSCASGMNWHFQRPDPQRSGRIPQTTPTAFAPYRAHRPHGSGCDS